MLEECEKIMSTASAVYFAVFFQRCFIYLSSGSTVSEDAGIEPSTVAALLFGLI